MRKIGVFVALVSVLLLVPPFAGPVAAQEEPGVIAHVYNVKPKAGMVQQFEAAYKQHIEWHRQQGDTWTWYTWQIVTGERFGTYGVGTFRHHWADFDNPGVPPDADAAHYLANVSQYVESVSSVFAAYLPDVSRPPAGEGPSPLSVVWHFQLRPGKADEFLHAVGKVKKAIEKTNWPSWSFWYALVNGGKHPTFVLVLPQKNWADLGVPEKPFDAMLEEAYGRQEAEAILKVFDKTIKSFYSEISRSRPDLSYIPAAE